MTIVIVKMFFFSSIVIFRFAKGSRKCLSKIEGKKETYKREINRDNEKGRKKERKNEKYKEREKKIMRERESEAEVER